MNTTLLIRSKDLDVKIVCQSCTDKYPGYYNCGQIVIDRKEDKFCDACDGVTSKHKSFFNF